MKTVSAILLPLLGLSVGLAIKQAFHAKGKSTGQFIVWTVGLFGALLFLAWLSDVFRWPEYFILSGLVLYPALTLPFVLRRQTK